jgi:hypothetical protein
VTAPQRIPRSLARVPSDRVTLWLHAAAILILVAEIVYWLAQPCVGDFLCAPVLGIYLAIVALPLIVAFVVWRVARRALFLVVVDTFVVGLVGGRLLTLLLGGAESGLVGFALGLVPLLLLGGIPGTLADLSERRLERWLTVAVLVAMAAWFALNGLVMNAIVPLVVALAAAGQVLSRPAPGE